MSSSRPPMSPVPQEFSEQTVHTPSPNAYNSLQGPVAILWDIENCPVPSDVRPEDVAGNIRMALRVNPVINGAITMFSAYGDFNAFPRRVREGCQRTGVKLVDVPNVRKDAADKAILVDMFLFALDNRPPSSIMLISGDVDFAPALHTLGQRGYTMILVIPSGVGVSSALSNAGNFVWDWPSVARGESSLTPSKALAHPRTSPLEVPGLVMTCQISNDNAVEGQNEEEAIVYRGNSRTKRELSVVSQSLTDFSSGSMSMGKILTPSSSCSFPCGLMNEVASGNDDQIDLVWVQPGDVNGLKGQLVKLLELAGGYLPFIRLPSEYQKLYGRPLYVSEYGSVKLVQLLKKMADAINIEGKGQRRIVALRNFESGQVCPPVILARRDNKGKVSPDKRVESTAVAGSSDELSDEEKIVLDKNENDMRVFEKLKLGKNKSCSQIVEQGLVKFRYELQEILVSYSCRVYMGFFEDIYQQRYKMKVDYPSLGVNHLEELLEKFEDVVMLQEDTVSKKKFLVAVGAKSINLG